MDMSALYQALSNAMPPDTDIQDVAAKRVKPTQDDDERVGTSGAPLNPLAPTPVPEGVMSPLTGGGGGSVKDVGTKIFQMQQSGDPGLSAYLATPEVADWRATLMKAFQGPERAAQAAQAAKNAAWDDYINSPYKTKGEDQRLRGSTKWNDYYKK